MPATTKPLALTQLGEEELFFRDTVRKFAHNEIAPMARAMDEAQKLDPALLKQLFAMGLMGIEIPEQFGGSGGSFFDAILAVEALSAVDPSVGVLVDVQNTLTINALIKWGNEAQKSRFLPKLATDTVASYALSEASSGSDAFALQTRATAVEGGYLLSGQKLWITNAMESGLFIVFATLDPALGYKGITAFLVEKGAAGFTLGKKEDKLGIRASSTAALLFDDCFVPSADVLGKPGIGYKIAIETLNEGRIGIAAQMLGLADGAWGHAAKWAKERKQFGKALVEFQAMQFQLAEMATEIEAARLMVYNAARLKDNGSEFLKEAAMAKYYASHVAEKVASLAVEVYGGSGFVKDYPVEKLYRDAKIGKIYEGTSFMQLATIAKLTLGKV
ncbi:butyryl-CoA dehydrogenase/short/branched chain acyl-CoA dehydrogenase [Granulicella pectinivorans]|uniref:Short/branched chain specific acyl-CoA dehydrogenase, mitochondrial n=1 Tax=Granulicella pectinivorans TaxID=474950 RepID=A0A1I6L0J2_9BACT|nr:acyl-CoA dehydrogenase family protein [Granulicella pectinivorans]SFR96966.1 butyryl-CoA dehydrogenase/short/branched chain acyl-CoA dehydrogenase [Granulicella pectinivorans]